MNSRCPFHPAALLLAGLTGCAAPEAAAPPVPTAAEAEVLMMAMASAAAPGPEHAQIAAWAGNWKVKLRMRMGPEEPWLDSSGTATFTSLLEGRYLAQKLSCTMKFGDVEMPFESLEVLGFNNVTKEYEAWWFDTNSTTPLYTHGTEVGGVIELRGTIKDMITPEGRPALFTHRAIDENHFFGEGWDTIPPAGLIKVVEVEYTRVLP